MNRKTRLKLALRNAYAAALRAVPDRLLIPMRDAYIAAPRASRRRAILHRVLQGLRYKHPGARMEVFTVPDAPAVRFLNVNSIVMRHAYWFGLDGWEGAEIRAWQYFCSRASRILEVGGNVGFYTVCGGLSAPGADYTVVEPHPSTVRILRRNLALNGLDRIRVIEAAVVGAKTSERMTLAVPAADQDEAPPGSFLAQGGELTVEAAASFEVPIVSIGELIAGVDLLKLDVEGYEFDILTAARQELMAHQPVIFLEVLSIAPQLQRWVADLGWSGTYRIFACSSRMTEINPSDVLSGRLRRLYGTRDVVLVPSSRPVPLAELHAMLDQPAAATADERVEP